ncbi:TlpA disulfide reductase family protein [Flavobacterium sp. SUN046]|uniref:TlpA family protein disulfide reductase n=1 Tax=Flavobacterium sp. SUN046 TaxID=3002440 RepID=UPI002DC00AE4|nr:TlpA disulfide reductase family protein [Flavobacterium sp. SUN046]MEC4048701.1 TlpA disulfide reductase family protein [Flavobacterium sp. SUN046]
MIKNVSISIVYLFLCSFKSFATYKQQIKSNRQNQIVLIFQKNSKTISSQKGSSVLTPSDIKYTEFGSYIERFLFPNNNNKRDTIVLKLNSESIVLSHVFDHNKVYYYQIKKGDTAVFNYNLGVPYLKITNRSVKKFDLNLESDISIKRPLEDFDFYVINKRNRNENEKKLYKQELTGYKNKYITILDSLVGINQLSKDLFDIHYNRVKFYEINSNKNFNNCSMEDLKMDNLLPIKTYRFFLKNYALNKFKTEKNNLKKNDFSDNGIAFDDVYQSNIFSKKTKEFLLYNFLRSLANDGGDISSRFKQFENVATDSLAVNEIKDNYLVDWSKFRQEILKTNFITLNKEVVALDQIISKNKNKVIYIDFWASWCAPCRASMKGAKELIAQFENKEVVFIYISIDSDFNKWESAVIKESLDKFENSLLALNFPNSLFYKELNLESIPRYILFDKNGVMVDANALKPDSVEIVEELNRYLKQ